MRVEHLSAHNFRNLYDLDVSLGPGFVIVEGQNGQGKTNLLEALYVCATGRSFRGAAPRELIHHDKNTAVLEAVFQRQSVRHHVVVNLANNRRRIQVDGRGLRKTSQLLDLLNVVAFFPDDLRIIKGAPEERRRFLDRVTANFRTEVVDASSGYEKALRSRNRLLREGQCDPTMLDIYDEQLCRFGTIVHRCRLFTLEQLLSEASTIFDEFMGKDLSLDIQLDSGINHQQISSQDFPGIFKSALQANRARDIARATTTSGPHRGDFIVFIDGYDGRSFGSQGQQRAVILALKIAEVRLLERMLGSVPILLLDDVSSELDIDRSRALFSAVEGLETQVWVSTTGAAPLPIAKVTQQLRVDRGCVVGHRA